MDYPGIPNGQPKRIRPRQIAVTTVVIGVGFLIFVGAYSPAIQHKVATVVAPPVHFSETEICPYRKDASGGFSPWWVAYIVGPAEGATDKSMYVEINGKRLGPYSNVSGLMKISRDGKHIAFAAAKNDNWVIVEDGVEKYTHKGLLWPWSAWSPSLEGNSFIPQTRAAVMEFSPDGRYLAYPAQTADGKYAVFVNGKQGQAFPDIGASLAFIAGRVQYYAFNGDKKLLEVYGDQVLGPYDQSFDTKVSPDGRHYAFWANSGTTNVLVVDGQARQIPGPISTYDIGANGAIAYAYNAAGKYHIRLNSTDLPGEYDEVTELTLSPNGKDVAFWERHEGTWSLWAMNHEYPGFGGYFYYLAGGEKYSVMWSPDSQHVAYYVRDGGGLALDGQKMSLAYKVPGLMLENIVDNQGTTVGAGMMSAPEIDAQAFVLAVLMRDKTKCDPFSTALFGQELTCIDKTDGSASMHIGDKTEGPYKGIHSVLFSSAHASHYAYIVETNMGQQVVVDGVLRPHIYDAIYRPVVDDSNGSLVYLAVKDGKLIRVTQPFGAD